MDKQHFPYKSFGKRIKPRRSVKGLIGLLVFASTIYVAFYLLIVNNPEVFLTESSVSFTSMLFPHTSLFPTSVVTEHVYPSQTVYVDVVHYGWLAHSHEKHFLTMEILCVSYLAIQKLQLKSKLNKYYSTLAIFTGLWVLSLIFLPVAGYDYALTLALTLASAILISATILNALLKLKVKGISRENVGNTLSTLGILTALWLTLSTFLGEYSLTAIALTSIAASALYLTAKTAGKKLKNHKTFN